MKTYKTISKSFPACYIALKLGLAGRMTIENSMAFNTGNYGRLLAKLVKIQFSMCRSFKVSNSAQMKILIGQF